jgi:hypothetical protein
MDKHSSLLAAALLAVAGPALAAPFSFSTGSVTDSIATATRPGPVSGPNQETETGDDFTVTGSPVRLDSASFTGLIPRGATVQQVVVELYRVFPRDSDVGRTSGAPVFSTPQVPTRVNSPADVAFDGRESGSGLSFTTTVLNNSATVNNSVDLGINPIPNQQTGGDGAVTGQQLRFDITFTSPFVVGPGHYFFVPGVLLADANQHFLWQSASRPIDATGTPFSPDLQAWIRNEALSPDWLRIGTDIIGNQAFNMAFTLAGTTVPTPSAMLIFGAGLAGLLLMRRRAGRAA